VAESLKGYVQKLKKGGYDEPTIRAHLFSQGYHLQQINEAFTTRNLVSKKTIFFIFGLAALVIILILGYFLLTPTSKTISFALKQTTSEISQGQPIVFDDVVTNTGKQSGFSVDVRHEVYDQNSLLIASSDRTIIASGTQTKRQELILPADLAIGRYSVKATASFDGGKSQQSSFSFKVVSGLPVTGTPSIPATPTTPEAPGAELCEANCKDNDLCTKDSCVGNSCIHEEITPCCGNFICEDIETTISCAKDCKTLPKGKTSTELLNEAASVAKSNPARAFLLCGSIIQESMLNSCFSNAADVSKNSEFCSKITDTEEKSVCYVDYVLATNDFSKCDNVEDILYKQTCYNLKISDAIAQSEQAQP